MSSLGIGITTLQKDREQLRRTGEGLMTETMARSCAQSTQLVTGGTAYGCLVGLRVGDVISNIVFQVTTAGAGTSLAKAGVYSKDGVTRHATGAGTNADFNSAGTKLIPLSLTVPADDAYMVIFVFTAATTLPTLNRSSGQSASTAVVGSGALPFCTAGTGLSDIPAAGATLTATNSFGWWVGIA